MFRARGRTLSARLIAIVAVLLTLACAVVGGATYFAVHHQLMSSLGEQVQEATDGWALCAHPGGGGPGGSGPGSANPGSANPGSANPGSTNPNGGSPGNGNPGDGGLSHPSQLSKLECLGLLPDTFHAELTGTTWTCYSVSKTNTNRCTLSTADKATLNELPATTVAAKPKPPATSLYTASIDGRSYLLTKIRIVDTDPDGDSTATVLVAGLPVAQTRNAINTVLLTEIVVFAAVLVLAAASGIWLVRLSLRPLRRVAATATQVAELPLESGDVALPGGVPDTDPRTEVGQVGAAFNRMLGHVQRALGRRAASEARLRRFAADASHELRTPLSAIRGYAELALRHPGPVPEEVTHALSRVQSESARMSVLVDDLLLLARLDAGRPLESAPVDLSRLCIDVTSDAQVARRDHRWRLDLPDDPVVVLGDEHRLHQVLANLLSNAGKHTPAGTTVTVALTDSDPVRPDSAAISVRDDGPGIPPDLIPELFERFTRADTSRWHADDNSGASTGLGLAIVDAVVTAHGGTIAVSSRPGDTRFTITLPRGS
jgi:two-component system, OmpR family, sensor kinase